MDSNAKKAIGFVAVLLLALGVVMGGGSDSKKSNTASKSQTVTTKTSAQNKQQNILVPDDVLDKAIKLTRKDVLGKDEQGDKYIRQLAIKVDQKNKKIGIFAIMPAATKPKYSLDLADTLTRRLAANVANIDNRFRQPGGKDYWGGIWDIYEITMGISTIANAENNQKWYVFEIVQPGVQGHHKWKMQYGN